MQPISRFTMNSGRRLRATLLVLAIVAVSGCTDDCKGGGWNIVTGSAAEPGYDPADPLGPVGSRQDEQRRLFDAIGREVFAPAYADLKSCAEELETAVEAYCAAPTADTSLLENAWRGAMRAWQLVQHIAVGPIEEANRRFRMQFYPGRGAVERNVDSVLGAGDPPHRGDDRKQTRGGLRACRQWNTCCFPSAGWTMPRTARGAANWPAPSLPMCVRSPERSAIPGRRAAPSSTTSSTPGATSSRETTFLVAILESLGIQSEFIADRKLNPALPANRNVPALESRYAENTAANIDANLDAFWRLFDSLAPDAYRLRDYLERAHEAGEITELIAAELERAQAALNVIEDSGYSLETIVTDHESRDVEPLYDSFQELSDLTVEAAIAAGVELGFNFQDGD